MTISEQIAKDFASGENAVVLNTKIGRVLVTRKEIKPRYSDHTQTIFKAQSLEVGVQIECKASNPFIALTNLYGFMNARSN